MAQADDSATKVWHLSDDLHASRTIASRLPFLIRVLGTLGARAHARLGFNIIILITKNMNIGLYNLILYINKSRWCSSVLPSD